MSVTEAGQAVQRSAFPAVYADDEPLAQALLDELAGSSRVGRLDRLARKLAGEPLRMRAPPLRATPRTARRQSRRYSRTSIFKW
jgi:hypothetical protein